jgi:hypothetical protein
LPVGRYSFHILDEHGLSSILSLVKGRAMASGVLEGVDFIEELRLRRWARENYVPEGRRAESWHPIVLEEMSRRDAEKAPQDDGFVLVGSH